MATEFKLSYTGSEINEKLGKIDELSTDIEFLSNYVTPQMFGAVGDGITDDTAAFVAAQNSDLPVYVPLGNYVVNDFDFSNAKEWVCQRSNNGQWFSDGTAILTSTGITISAGVKISNLVVKYNGTENPENRPSGVRMKAHFCEIQGMHISNFYVGMDFGEHAGGHSDYCRIYDLYSWYNYFCGVRMCGTDDAQVNFITFFDANANSNGVDVHNRSVEPDTSRGYGFYVSLANSVYIHNADVSSNETCGIYIDNAIPAHTLRGFVVDTIYAEHNKFCNIYYNNGSVENTKTRHVDIRNAFFWNDATDLYYREDVYMTTDFVPPTVSFLRVQPDVNLPDCYSPDINIARSQARKTYFNKFYGRSGNSYKVTLTVQPEFADDFEGESDNLVFQNAVKTYEFDKNGLYTESTLTLNDVEKIPVFYVKLVRGEIKTFSFYVTLPNKDGAPLVYESMTYTSGGTKWHLIDGKVENVTPVEDVVVYGTPPNGAIRNVNGTPLICINGRWAMLKVDESGSGIVRNYTNLVPTSKDYVTDGVFNAVGFRNDCTGDAVAPYYYDYAGYCSTGIIDYTVPNNGLPPVIYIKGAVSIDESDNTKISLWTSGKTYKSIISSRSVISSYYYNITEIESGYYKLEPIENASGRSNIVDNHGSGITGISLSLKGIGYGLVVTLDEPIE